jgi:hypothetical protein
MLIDRRCPEYEGKRNIERREAVGAGRSMIRSQVQYLAPVVEREAMDESREVEAVRHEEQARLGPGCSLRYDPYNDHSPFVCWPWQV